VAVLASVVVGLVIGRASIQPAQRPHDDTRRTQASAPTARGAVRAAIAYLDALAWDVLIDDARRRRAIRARATPAAVAELDAELAAPAEALRGAVTRPPVVARSAVLGYRIPRFDDRRASIRVWGVALFGTGAYEPTTQWSTSDIGLVWSRDRWLVEGIRSHGGPSPDSPVRALARHARDFREVRHVP
jgi:hypothetical protein